MDWREWDALRTTRARELAAPLGLDYLRTLKDERIAGRTLVTRCGIFCNMLQKASSKASFKCPSVPLGPTAQSRRQSEWRIIVRGCARRACVRCKSGCPTAALPVLPKNVISRRAPSPPAIRRAMRSCALSPVSMNGQSHNSAWPIRRRRDIRRLW
jgi:hypothetical protein